MARTRRVAQKTAAVVEGNEKNLQFTLERFKVIKRDIEFYKAQQAELKEEELKLLKFKGLEKKEKQEDAEEEDDDNDSGLKTDQLLKKVNQIKQQIGLINKVTNLVETNLHFNDTENKKNGLSDEQILQSQIKQISEEQSKYTNLVFNMDYQLDVKERKERGGRDDSSPYKWFELKPSDQNNQIRIYSYSNSSFYAWVQQFTKSNTYDHLYISIQRLETESDYFKFEDFLQTIKLSNNKFFETITIDVQFENNLCVLALLRTLLSLENYNSLKLQNSYTRVKLAPSNIKDILESVFEVIFSNRQLQNLSFQIPVDLFDYLVASFPRVNPTLSQLRVYNITTDLKTVDANKVSDYFKFFSTLPNLHHIGQSAIPVSTSGALENLNVIFKRVKSAKVNLASIPSSFNFEFYLVNLKNLSFDFGLEPNILTSEKLENLLKCVKEAVSLEQFRLNIYSYIPQETSRKEILKNAQKVAKGQLPQPETQDETPAENVEGLKLFDNLSELTKLEDINVSIKADQYTYDSLHKLLIRSTSLQKYNINIQYHKEKHLMAKFFDLQNIYSTINSLSKKFKKVIIKTPHGSLHYQLPNKDSSLYDFKTSFNHEINHPQYNFKPFDFKFDKVKSIKIQQSSVTDIQDLNELCKSLSLCKSLKDLNLQLSALSTYLPLKTKPFIHPELPFFKQLETLPGLENIFISSFFDQHILNSIASLIEKSTKLKSLIFKKESHFTQLYLDYSPLFKALTGLSQLQQVYFRLGLEDVTVSEAHVGFWKTHKATTYHDALCNFIKEAQPSLQIVDLDETTFNQDFMKKILQALVDAKHHHYMKFNSSLSNTITQSDDEEIIDLLKICDNKGVLVKPYFRFPLTQPTGSYYDHNYSYW